MTPQIVFAVYRPHAGKSDALKKLIKEHLPTLRKLELITSRPDVLVQAKDGAFIEVFEWVSDEAAENAHEHPAVARIWEAMGQVCDFGALDSLAESKKPFSHFTPVAL